MQQKKLLFACHDVLDLYKIYKYGFEKYSNCEVTTIILKKYKNKIKRLQNFLSKLILNKNLKEIWQQNELLKNIDTNIQYDYAVTICADIFSEKTLLEIKKKSKQSIVYYWDGFDHFPKYKETLPFFDSHFTFDPVDAKKYHINFLPNFYYEENINENPIYDIYFLSSLDSRIFILEQIINCIEKQNNRLKIKILQYSKTNQKNQNLHKKIEYINHPITKEENLNYIINSKIILDVQKSIQTGLTFRVFEAIGFRKKLITTNKEIINYDFYNPKNIFIWTEETNSIPDDFLNLPYQDLPREIFEKYSQKNWVETILGLNKTF